MVTIKDPALGEYSVVEDYQSIKVKDGSDKFVVTVSSFEEALRFIAQRLVLDSNVVLTLSEYTKKRKEVYETIIQAQETNKQEPLQQVIEFGDSAHV